MQVGSGGSLRRSFAFRWGSAGGRGVEEGARRRRGRGRASHRAGRSAHVLLPRSVSVSEWSSVLTLVSTRRRPPAKTREECNAPPVRTACPLPLLSW
ncbi:hypothetical protein BDA96_03G011900 [Sorghum bicolor]|uniref:Uncharacterized protein n=2 Tax=Sorghum bicolor TaxID=4558 RepID=A0A921R9Q8_SORBI|nr:hypothetical protein BDA96_03G011900 [Sorghum bicolor]OQU86082.1 hypothetical protein SORBI_3003G010650 [Sorghum bicolor]